MKRRILTTTVRMQNQIKNVKKPTFEDFKSFNEKFSIIHDFVVRVLVIGTILTLGYFLTKEITTNKYVLTSIDVANSINDDNDKNTKVYPEDLKQNIILDTKEILSVKYNTDYVEADVSDISESISGETVPLNIAGFDLNQLYLYLRSFFKMQNRELRAYLMKSDDGNKYKLLLNIGGNTRQLIQYFSPTIKEKYISTYLSKEILLYNSPYKLGLFLLKQRDPNFEKTKYISLDAIDKDISRVISYLENLENNERWWEKIFQNNRWREKKEYLQVLQFTQQNNCRIDVLKYSSLPQYCDYIELLEGLNTQNKQKNKPFISVYEAEIDSCKSDSLGQRNLDKFSILHDKLNNRIDTVERFYKKFIESNW